MTEHNLFRKNGTYLMSRLVDMSPPMLCAMCGNQLYGSVIRISGMAENVHLEEWFCSIECMCKSEEYLKFCVQDTKRQLEICYARKN